ncbi:hypothetical protein RFF58_10105, partial [Streptococcus ruminantium]|nr:hypothetical protein [Streptococcus ruminantium]
DSYQGSRTDPLSHNLYTYVQNNPANYTDPSGHYGSPFAMMEGGRGRPVRGYSQPKPLMNPTDGTLYAPSTPEHRAHQVRQQQTQIYSYNYTPSPNAPRTSYQQTLWQQAQAQRSVSNAWEQAKAIGQSVYDWGASKTREATNIARNWTKSLEETITHVCTTAERWVEAGVNFLRNVDWKAVGITAAATVVAVAATAATAGAAAPVIAGVVGAGGLGLTGATATVTTGMAVGAVSGAVGGGSYAFTSGVLSGKQAGSIVKDVGSSILGGATTGLFTGGLLSGLGGATSGIGNALGRQAADTVIETAVDTVVDAAQGGNISPTSIGTSLAINAITEGVSSKTVKGQKGEVVRKGTSLGPQNTRNSIPEPTFKSSYDIPKNDKGYTKSNLKLGQDVHKEYKIEDVFNGLREKEFQLPSGKRVDFVDFDNNIVYELKPNNPNQIKKGNKQLQGYIDELESITDQPWTGVLDTY